MKHRILFIVLMSIFAWTVTAHAVELDKILHSIVFYGAGGIATNKHPNADKVNGIPAIDRGRSINAGATMKFNVIPKVRVFAEYSYNFFYVEEPDFKKLPIPPAATPEQATVPIAQWTNYNKFPMYWSDMWWYGGNPSVWQYRSYLLNRPYLNMDLEWQERLILRPIIAGIEFSPGRYSNIEPFFAVGGGLYTLKGSLRTKESYRVTYPEAPGLVFPLDSNLPLENHKGRALGLLLRSGVDWYFAEDFAVHAQVDYHLMKNFKRFSRETSWIISEDTALQKWGKDLVSWPQAYYLRFQGFASFALGLTFSY